MSGLQELLDGVQHSILNNFNEVKVKFDNIKEIMGIYLILYTSAFATYVSDKYNYVYKNSIVAKKTIDYLKYFISYTYSFLINKKIEPMRTNWISSYVLSKSNETNKYLDDNKYFEQEFVLLESYEFIDNPYKHETSKLVCEINYNDIYNAVNYFINIREAYSEGLVKMKLGDNYVYRVIYNSNNKKKDINEFVMPLVPSKTKFLSIEYTHPIMKNDIIIDLDKSIYFVNNQILSATFIKLYLEHQSELYHFDLDYVLKIMDDNLNIFELKSDKFIMLTENGYDIMKNL
jgi:hypothetical protein